MNWKYIKRKIIRKLHLGGVYYKILDLLQSDDSVKNYNPMELEEYVSSIHPDTGGSCLCKNTIEEPSCDLQIIVPVYNVEQYLRECIDSILNQETEYTYHVVVVNDGSTDNSRKILEEYSTDKRVTIIDKENGGSSSARNIALRRIFGKYITFVDSDDRMPQGAIQALMTVAIAHDADLVRGGYNIFRNEKKHQVCIYEEGSVSPLNIAGVPWGIVYKNSIWENICFPDRYWYEDTNCFIVSLCSKTAYTTRKIVYDYRLNNVGMTHLGIGNKKSVDSFYVTRRILKNIEELGKIANQDLYECMLRQMVTNFIRIVDLGNARLDKAIFLLSCDMIESYFPNMQSQTPFGKQMEEIIRNRDFKHFRLNSLYRW